MIIWHCNKKDADRFTFFSHIDNQLSVPLYSYVKTLILREIRISRLGMTENRIIPLACFTIQTFKPFHELSCLFNLSDIWFISLPILSIDSLAYIIVVLILVCPNIFETDSIETPKFSISVANACLATMAREILLDAAHICDLFQVGIHILIGRYWQQSFLLVFALIFLQYLLRYIKQGDIVRDARLVS